MCHQIGCFHSPQQGIRWKGNRDDESAGIHGDQSDMRRHSSRTETPSSRRHAWENPGIGILLLMISILGSPCIGTDPHPNKVAVEDDGGVSGVNPTGNAFDASKVYAKYPGAEPQGIPSRGNPDEGKLYTLVERALTESPLIDG